MNPEEKEKLIYKLVRNDYPFQTIQELLAELVISTHDLYGSDSTIENRFDNLLRSFFGEPFKKSGLPDNDTEWLLMVKKLIAWGIAPYTACEQVAKYFVLRENFKWSIRIGKLSDKQNNEIKAKTRSLYRIINHELKKSESLDKAAEEQFHLEGLEDEFRFEELKASKTFLAVWLQNYMSY